MKRLRRIVLGLVAAAAVLLLGATAFVYSGAYDISATDQHTPPVYWLMEFTMRRSVAVRAKEGETPDLTGAQTIAKGLQSYHARCVECHGAPGISPSPAALGMTPAPANLVQTAREWSAAEIRWVVTHGIKMTGMPAWKYRMTDDEIWQVVAFVKHRLPYLMPSEYQALTANLPSRAGESTATPLFDVSADAGRRAIDQYACATCHVIPGITGATREVGPPLRGVAGRSYIAGVLANTPENMVRWLMSPQHVSPGSAMPDLRVREQDARDITAYLATLKRD